MTKPAMVSEDILNMANSIEQFHRLRANRSERELEHDDWIAINWAILALRDCIVRDAKAAIKVHGLDFWAEIFGAEGSLCEDCQGGYCIRHSGTTNMDFDNLEDCGFCYYHIDELVKGLPEGRRVCLKTKRAVEAPFTDELRNPDLDKIEPIPVAQKE